MSNPHEKGEAGPAEGAVERRERQLDRLLRLVAPMFQRKDGKWVPDRQNVGVLEAIASRARFTAEMVQKWIPQWEVIHGQIAEIWLWTQSSEQRQAQLVAEVVGQIKPLIHTNTNNTNTEGQLANLKFDASSVSQDSNGKALISIEDIIQSAKGSDKKAEELLKGLGVDLEGKKLKDLKEGDLVKVNGKMMKAIKRGQKMWLWVGVAAAAGTALGVGATLGVQWYMGDSSTTLDTATDGSGLRAVS